MLSQLKRLGHVSTDEWQTISQRIDSTPRRPDAFLDTLSPPPSTHAGGAIELLELNPDHPGFADQAYRSRRNAIAQQALDYNSGDPIPHAEYSPDEERVWALVNDELDTIHQSLVCREILILKQRFNWNRHSVPQLSMVNERLQQMAGFRMEPVAGLVNARTFLSYLGRRVFLSTQYIRHSSRPLYTPEPDIIHELIGHAATLAHPGIAEVNRLLGRAALLATDSEMLRLERVYWYTMEFGLVKQGDDIKAYGAGLLSSIGELRGFWSNATFKTWDLNQMALTPYDPTCYQDQLFVAPSFTAMLSDLCCWLRLGGWKDSAEKMS